MYMKIQDKLSITKNHKIKKYTYIFLYGISLKGYVAS